MRSGMFGEQKPAPFTETGADFWRVAESSSIACGLGYVYNEYRYGCVAISR